MRLRDVFGDPIREAQAVIANLGDRQRVERARRRVDLYNDNFGPVLAAAFSQFYDAPENRDELISLSRFAGSSNLLKRVSDETARPIYATPVTRHVDHDPSDLAYQALMLEAGADRQLDLVCRLIVHHYAAFLFVRFVPGRGLIIDALTPDMVRVIPDPEVPTRAAGFMYERKVRGQGAIGAEWVLWDSCESTTFTADGAQTGPYVEHGLGRLPFVEIHRRARWGSYWAPTMGQDLEEATILDCLLTAVLVRLHKHQSHLQIAMTGDGGMTPHSQTLGAANILTFDSAGVQVLNLQADSAHLIRTKELIATTIAAAYGISRERLNQTVQQPSTDVGLRERTAEIMTIMRVAEVDLFDLIKRVSREHPEHKIADDARVEVEFGPLQYMTDRKTQLEVRDTERKMGVRSILDDIYEDHPEIQTEAEAWAEVDRNMAAEAQYIVRRRALNIADDANAHTPGQPPDANGALGPMVRDGRITRDQAAMMASGENGDMRARVRAAIGMG